MTASPAFLSAPPATRNPWKELLASLSSGTFEYEWLPDGTERFVAVSEEFTKLLGVPAEAILRDALLAWDVIPKEERQSFHASLSEASQKLKPWRQRFRIVRVDSTVRWLEGCAVPHRETDGLIRWTGTFRDITDEIASNTEAARISERFELAARGAKIGIWELDLLTFESIWDEQMFEIYKLDPEKGAPAMGDFLEIIFPDDLQHFVALWQKINERAGSWHTQFRMVRGDGAIRNIEAFVHTHADSTGRVVKQIGMNKDITEQVVAEKELVAARELLEQVGEVSSTAGWEIDLSTGKARWTRELARMLDIQPHPESTFTEVLRCFDAPTANVIQKAIDRIWDDGGVLSLEILHGQPPTQRTLRVLGRAVFGARRIVGAFQDITAQKRAEADRLKLEHQLYQAQKMETLGTLAGGIAHDFNNILSILLGNVELALLDTPENDSRRFSLEETRRAAFRARDLVHQILSFSRSHEHKRTTVDVALVVQEALAFMRASLPTSIRVVLDTTPDTHFISGDPTQINQVIMNLCANALDAMEETGGELTLRLERVEVDSAHAAKVHGLRCGNYTRLTCRDTGAGMSEEIQKRIFEPFYTTKAQGKGTGLGLAVVYGIVTHHAGAIAVDSQVGAGTCFYVYLPLIESDASAPTEKNLEAALHGNGETVLIVDDEPSVAAATARQLERLGYRTLIVEGNSGAIAKVLGNVGDADLLVTDQTMPGLSGLEIARAVRRSGRDLPVIIMSGYNRQLRGGIPSDIHGVSTLAKPFTFEALASAISNALAAVR